MITTANSISEALKNKETITVLNLKSSRLEEVPEEIKELKLLQKLFIQNNQLTSLPSWLKEMKRLEYIDAHNNHIQTFGDLPPKLETLEIYDNHLLEIPSSFCKLQKIKILNLRKNQLSELPKEFENVLDEKLQIVNLEFNKFTKFPTVFFQFNYIESINLSYNKITDLPVEIGQWTLLKSLQIGNNLINKIPDSITNCKLLRELSLFQNQLTELPNNIGECNRLINLSISGNQLTSLPSSLENMIWIKNFNISRNKISHFSFDLGKLKSLENIWLSYNQFTELPDVFDLFPHIYDIGISNNPLQNLPLTLLQKDNIHTLSMDNLALTEKPFKVLFMSNLKYLFADKCGIDKEVLTKRKTFAKAAETKKSSWDDVKIFYNIATQVDNLNNYSLSTFFEALSFNFLMTQTNALNFIRKNWKEKLAKHPIQKGVSITALGKTSFKKNEVKKKLKEWGIEFTSKITDKTTHVILEKGVKKYDGIDKENLIFIPEQSLQDFINENETLYLNEETTPQEERDNIRSLLLSVESDMVAIGVEMMSNLGVPLDCMEALFLVLKNTNHSISIRNKAKKLLLLHGDSQLKANIEKYKSANVISKKEVHDYVIHRDLQCLTNNTKLNLVTITEYLHIYHNFKLYRVVDFLNNDEQKIELLKRILQHNPHSYITNYFLQDASKLTQLPIKKLLLVNSYESFPLEFLQLTELEELSIRIKGLTEIPKEFAKLTKLHTLYLSKNKINIFPTVFNTMKNLKNIHLENSPFATRKRQIPSEEIFDLSEYPKKITRK